jgi:hypothetical protein
MGDRNFVSAEVEHYVFFVADGMHAGLQAKDHSH